MKSRFIYQITFAIVCLATSEFTLLHRVQAKTNTVSLTQTEWGNRLQTLQNTKEIMRKSTLPGNIISAWSDSVDVMIKDVNEQVGAQLQAEQKAAAKKDSATNKQK